MRELVIIGIGELGKLLGAGALRVGARVTPVTRTMHVETALKEIAPRTPILVSVGEGALPALLAALPAAHRESVVLLQNELFPSIYRAAQLNRPSILVPWVLQKPSMPTIVARPSPIYGDQADFFTEIFAALSLAHVRIASEGALAQALVDKYTFILTINALGLATDRTLGMWLQEDPAQVWDICNEASRLGEVLVEAPIDAAQAQRATQEAMVALSHVPARGRSARERVERALGHATRLGLSLSAIAHIAQTH